MCARQRGDTSSEWAGPQYGRLLSYYGILEREVGNAVREIDRPRSAVFVSGVAAGLNLGFGALFMGMVLTFAGGFESVLIRRLAMGGASTLGFLFVILGQTELFTAHTTLAMLAALDGRATWRELGRLWSTVFTANLVGGIGFAGLIAYVGTRLGIVEPAAFGRLAGTLLAPAGGTILLSGVVAGWLMGLTTWLNAASQDTISRVVIIVLVTGGIGFAPFHHVVLGSTEVVTALFLGQGVTLLDFGRFVVPTAVGNAVGGGVFVALLNYSHVALSGDSDYTYYGSDGTGDLETDAEAD